MNINNILINSDSYKHGHWKMYPEDAKYISSYIEARGTKTDIKKVCLFGLQIFLMTVMKTRITHEDIDYAEERVIKHGLPFNRAGWEIIVNECNGFLPLHIQAIPEGQVTPLGTPLVQITNTHPGVPWLVSYIETAILRAVWFPSTIASQSLHDLMTINRFMNMTTGSTEGAEFMKHDFGARGVSSNESAAIGGLAHLASGFMGTDTFAALEYGKEFYVEDMAGFSVIASEHSTTTINGEEGELEFIRKMINMCPDNGIVSVVIDSYNDIRVLEEYLGKELYSDVIALGERGGRLVSRPDSGNPVEVPIDCVRRLGKIFGMTKNEQGYLVLPDFVRVLQGDGINSEQLEEILEYMEDEYYASSNILFGMGGGLLQKLNRDTFQWAMKCNAWSRDGVSWIPVQKKPISGKKASKPGHICGVFADGTYETIDTVDTSVYSEVDNLLETVYIHKETNSFPSILRTSLSSVRQRAKDTY